MRVKVISIATNFVHAREEYGIEIAMIDEVCVLVMEILRKNIHVNCRKSVDFFSVKNIQVVVVDSWKKWLNFVSDCIY